MPCTVNGRLRLHLSSSEYCVEKGRTGVLSLRGLRRIFRATRSGSRVAAEWCLRPFSASRASRVSSFVPSTAKTNSVATASLPHRSASPSKASAEMPRPVGPQSLRTIRWKALSKSDGGVHPQALSRLSNSSDMTSCTFSDSARASALSQTITPSARYPPERYARLQLPHARF